MSQVGCRWQAAVALSAIYAAVTCVGCFYTAAPPVNGFEQAHSCLVDMGVDRDAELLLVSLLKCALVLCSQTLHVLYWFLCWCSIDLNLA